MQPIRQSNSPSRVPKDSSRYFRPSANTPYQPRPSSRSPEPHKRLIHPNLPLLSKGPRSHVIDTSFLQADNSHWDEYEARIQRVFPIQFRNEYQQLADHFEGVKRNVSVAKASQDMLAKRDELRAMQEGQKKEQEMKQREVIEWLRRRQQVQELKHGLTKQLEEKKETRRFAREVDKAYAQQIDYRISKIREIDQHRLESENRSRDSYKSALLKQISDRSQSRQDLARLGQAEQQAVSRFRPDQPFSRLGKAGTLFFRR